MIPIVTFTKSFTYLTEPKEEVLFAPLMDSLSGFTDLFTFTRPLKTFDEKTIE